MLTIFTRGPARITVSELGSGRGLFIALAVLGALASGVADSYARTIGEAITITVIVLFSLTMAVVVVMVALLARRIRRELRAGRQAPPMTRPAIRTAATVAPELADRRPAMRAIAAAPARPVWPTAEPYAIPADPAPRGQQ